MQKKIFLYAGLLGLAVPLQGQSFSEISIENEPSPPAAVQKLIADAKNKEMTEEEISLLQKNLSNRYIEQGYITSFVSLKEENREEGRLVFLLKKGYIDNIVSDDSYWPALPFKSGDVLKIQEIDQAVENLKTSLTDVEIDIVPSEKPSYSDIHIQKKRKKQLSGLVSFDNDNYKDHGRENVFVSLNRDYLLFAGDMVNVSWKERITDSREKYRKSTYNFSYTIPIGFSKLQYQFSREDNKDSVIENRYKTKKNEDNHKIELSRVFFRNAKQKWEGYSYVNVQKNRNYFDGIKLEVSSKRYSRVGVGLRNLYYLSNGYIFTDIGFEKGVPIFGGEGDKNNNSVRDPFKKEFSKWNVNVSGSKALFVNAYGYLNYSFRFSGAYSPDHLLDSNKFEMGGVNSVRGFKESTIKGDKGLSLQNTLSWEGKHWSPFIGLDYGLSRDRYRDSSDSIAGMAAGLRYHNSSLEAELTFSKSLQRAKDMPKESPPIYFKLSYKF